MSLLTPSPADVIERLTILELKILHGELQEKDVEHFRAEKQALIEHLGGLGRMPGEFVVPLAIINALIWTREDRVRDLIREHEVNQFPTLPEIGELALGTRKLGDRRHAILKEIDASFGIERKEKL